ncbi:MAG: nucleotidyltransferase family protein [Candidatus Sumerlaeaceae bacterium]|nr:nucleotidyltransferase family protein [Candidatus Sumerlaeaceae bacterium]
MNSKHIRMQFALMTLEELRQRRQHILAAATKHGARNVRVFGSVARGEASPHDVDLLVRFDPGRSLLDHAALKRELEALCGVPVDIASEPGVKPKYRARILAEAIAL